MQFDTLLLHVCETIYAQLVIRLQTCAKNKNTKDALGGVWTFYHGLYGKDKRTPGLVIYSTGGWWSTSYINAGTGNKHTELHKPQSGITAHISAAIEVASSALPVSSS